MSDVGNMTGLPRKNRYTGKSGEWVWWACPSDEPGDWSNPHILELTHWMRVQINREMLKLLGSARTFELLRLLRERAE